MPTGDDPPKPRLPETVFDALAELSYDSTNKCFDDNGDRVWMFIEEDSTGSYNSGAWFYGETADGGLSPWGLIPQNTYDIIDGGTYNDGGVKYEGTTYRFALQNVSGKFQVIAVAI